jgi:hypothetical protein
MISGMDRWEEVETILSHLLGEKDSRKISIRIKGFSEI